VSRSGYSDDVENWDLIRWRGAVASAIRGKRGQAFLREMAAVLDAMPVKRLVDGELQADGEVCALGAVGVARGLPVSDINPDDREAVAEVFGIAPALAAEIESENDGDFSYRRHSTPEQRWQYMRDWVAENIV
jgi:hypothetical protein